MHQKKFKKGYYFAEIDSIAFKGKELYLPRPEEGEACFQIESSPRNLENRARGHKRLAFTLAEVLIVLGVIGVVAALTLPTLISNVNDKVVARQIQVIQRKINQGTEGMQVRGALLENYGSTSAFIDELSKDMKIISKCDSEHLTDCWPYEKITVKQPVGEEKDIPILSHVNGTEAFQMTGNWGEVMGIIFGNGTPMLLSYNKNCPAIDPDSTYEVDKATGMSETSQCIAGVYDINGKRGPNKLYQDVIPFRANGYTDSYWFKTSEGKYFKGMQFLPTEEQGLAVGNTGACSSIWSTKKYTDTNNLFGTGLGKEITIVLLSSHGYKCDHADDRFLAAAVQCGAYGGRLPKFSEFIELSKILYPDAEESTYANQPKFTGQIKIPKEMEGIFSKHNRIWGAYQFYDGAVGWEFHPNHSSRTGAQVQSNNTSMLGLCVGD